MPKRSPRGNLPWPVAPVPEVPEFAASLTTDEVADRLDGWHGELDHWLHIWRKRDASFYRRLPKVIGQARELLRRAQDLLPEDLHVAHGVEKRSTLANYHNLLARALSETSGWAEGAEADREFRQARSLAPEVSDYWYRHVRHLILGGRICEALEEINAVDARTIRNEQDSLAQQIVNWALAYREIGFGIRADIVKQCIALMSQVGTGLLVRGCPLPHPPGHKWQRTEILRVLWAGMPCSIPVDELCRREGIDQATYYRWRRRYMPPEWGLEPALV
ncbi:MAG: helix-turn-helix domain-containing protein [Isosphaeraceae bacterium]